MQRECETTNSQVPADYPWSIAGHHTSAVARYHSLGIRQSADEPSQFSFCADCPCPTSKQSASDRSSHDTTKTSTRITKTVVHFAHASAELNERDVALLSRFYTTLPQNSQITITGFTDDSAPGGTITNESLALNRATTVRDFLISLGLQENQATVKASPLCCYVAANNTDSGRALNRRVELHTTSLSTPKQANK
ncbi:MAG: OmpA family protein [Candidatus Thiodiazotropha weberae]|nr:OmpA family protein [Candidatus Thiodiazotropha lotti]MCG8011902.1 OmpA family protein [Candidatus Thiodiazotropha lotti]MCW4211369.1 OmpA family protein [Candidatus Thiodiazotropha lotti]MCW4216780.1 OmpA family protein [Candidatus Thiodiazotropha lotti]